MKTILRISFASLLLLLGGNSVSAQKKACPIPPPSPYKHTAHIATRYDSSADLMRTVLEHPMTLGGTANPLYLFASFAYRNSPSTSAASRTNVEVALVSVAPAPRFRDAHDLRLFADGRELPRLAAEQYLAEQTKESRTIEWTRISLTSTVLLDIAKAKQVEVALGSEHYRLTENHLEALRELASLIRAPVFTTIERKDAYALPASGY